MKSTILNSVVTGWIVDYFSKERWSFVMSLS